LFTQVDRHIHAPFTYIIWKKTAPLKVSLFAWKSLNKMIPTKNVEKRNLNHLFLICAFFGSIWHCILRWLGIHNVLPNDVGYTRCNLVVLICLGMTFIIVFKGSGLLVSRSFKRSVTLRFFCDKTMSKDHLKGLSRHFSVGQKTRFRFHDWTFNSFRKKVEKGSNTTF
jgi:hypothetical protein